MFCANCGVKLEDGDAFCGNCGTPTETEEATLQTEEALAQQQREDYLLQLQTPTHPAYAQDAVPASQMPEEPQAQMQETPEAAEETEPEVLQETMQESYGQNQQPSQYAPAAEPACEIPDQPEVPVKAEKSRRKPHIALRILMQFLSTILCIILTASLLATVILADMNMIMSEGGMQKLFDNMLSISAPPHQHTGVMAASGTVNVNVEDIINDVLADPDNLQNVEALVEAVYEALEAHNGRPLDFSPEQLMSFVQKSTIADFIASKLSGFTQDFINDTQYTVITSQELEELIDENLPLLEREFAMVVTPQSRNQMVDALDKMVNEQDLNDMIQEKVFVSVENAINDTASITGMTWDDIQPIVQILCADLTLYLAIAVCLMLMVLMCALNFYNVPAGLTWSAIPCIVLGSLLTLIPYVLGMLGSASDIRNLLDPFLSVLQPIHLSLLIVGVVLLVASIIWRVVRKVVRNKRAAAQPV